jgi:alkylhydroperoxidase/carboxymuconolactone decarboxylase family protein YurZ
MPDFAQLLDDRQLARLRVAYAPPVMRTAMLNAIAVGYPPLLPWNEAIAKTFYDDPEPLSAANRERCLIALLTHTGPQLSLAIHVYWGLMEGLSVAEVCHIVGLAACYGGVPRLALGLPVVERTLRVLSTLEGAQVDSQSVLLTLVSEYK